MISFGKLNGVDLGRPSVFTHPVESKKSLMQAEADSVISKKPMIDMKELGKGHKVDTKA